MSNFSRNLALWVIIALLVMALFNLFIGLAIAMSSVISRQIGEGNHDRVRRIVTHGVIIALAFGFIVTLIGLAVMEPLLRFLGADETTLPLAKSYMDIWFWGNIFLAVPIAGNAAMRAAGDAVTPAVILNLAALLNIILNPLFIFGIGPFPRLEIEGAALTTVFSNFCAMAAVLYVLGVRKKMLCTDGLHLGEMKDSLRRLVFIALPAGLTGMITPVVNGFITAILSTSGAAAIAAFGVVGKIEALAFVVLMGLATGMGPVLGQNWGAKNFGRVRETLDKAFLFVIGWSLFMAALLALTAHPVAGLFSDDPAVVHTATLYLWIVPISYALGNLVNGWSSAFNSFGLPLHGLGLILLKNLVLTLPLAWMGNAYFGIAGLFAGLAAVNIIAGIAAHIWGLRILAQKSQ